jgi:hypothetical protein
MKKIAIVLILLVGVNLLFYPKRITQVLSDAQTGKPISEKKVLFFSPIESNDYDGSFFTIGSFSTEEIQKLAGGRPTQVWVNTNSNFTPIVESATDIWLIYILTPSIILLILVVVFTTEKKQNNETEDAVEPNEIN